MAGPPSSAGGHGGLTASGGGPSVGQRRRRTRDQPGLHVIQRCAQRPLARLHAGSIVSVKEGGVLDLACAAVADVRDDSNNGRSPGDPGPAPDGVTYSDWLAFNNID